ncbi:hypothetical protein BT96DRAFT_795010, partial [Gymnopus androsaceus JB14]
ELEHCEKQIEALESRRQSLRSYTARLRSMLSPFRKVPDEILRRILNGCWDMNHFTLTCKDEETSGDIRDTPALTLSSVCSRWRRNALSMPSLWSGISLACQPMSGTDGYEEKLPFILDVFLSRALPHPLTIAIDVAE